MISGQTCVFAGGFASIYWGYWEWYNRFSNWWTLCSHHPVWWHVLMTCTTVSFLTILVTPTKGDFNSRLRVLKHMNKFKFVVLEVVFTSIAKLYDLFGRCRCIDLGSYSGEWFTSTCWCGWSSLNPTKCSQIRSGKYGGIFNVSPSHINCCELSASIYGRSWPLHSAPLLKLQI